jgi:hypothetical protein
MRNFRTLSSNCQEIDMDSLELTDYLRQKSIFNLDFLQNMPKCALFDTFRHLAQIKQIDNQTA